MLFGLQDSQAGMDHQAQMDSLGPLVLLAGLVTQVLLEW